MRAAAETAPRVAVRRPPAPHDGVAVRPQPVARADRHIAELDGIRGMAILMVLLYHLGTYQAPKGSLLYFVLMPRQLGWSGVDLFFVLSGFLIGGMLLDHRHSPKYFPVFYARRLHRILPLYGLLVASLFVGMWLWPDVDLFRGTMPLWTYPLFLQNTVVPFTSMPIWMNVTWSLAVEEQFYLVLPFLVRIMTRRSLLTVCLSCIVLAPLLRTAMVWREVPFGFTYALLPCRADALAGGVIAAMIFRDGSARRWLQEHSSLLYACLAAAAGIAALQLKWTTEMVQASLGHTALAFTYFCLMLVVLIAPLAELNRLLRRRWMEWLGSMSYCVYLIHLPVLFGLFRMFGYRQDPAITNLATLGLTLLSVVVMFGMAQVSSVYLERPLIQRAHRLYRY
jgi:peptidoglycan/LPS O-acetylase OafA/YrhL